MPTKPGKRIKHIPQRTCVGCREVLPKRSLIRVVKTVEGVQVDLSGRLSGRGAYLHNVKTCWERGLKGPLASALKTELSEHDRQALNAFLATLPEGMEEEVKTSSSIPVKPNQTPSDLPADMKP